MDLKLKKFLSNISSLEVVDYTLLALGKNPPIPHPLKFFLEEEEEVGNCRFLHFSHEEREFEKCYQTYRMFYIESQTKKILINFFVALNSKELHRSKVSAIRVHIKIIYLVSP